MEAYKQLSDAVVNCQRNKIAGLTEKALKAEDDIQSVVEKGFLSGMSIVEKKMRKGKIYIPEVLMAAETAKQGMNALIRSHRSSDAKLNRGTVVMGSVKGDLHHAGKAVMKLMCECTGLKVIDIGQDADADRFIENIKKHDPDLVCLTAFLRTSLPGVRREMEKTIKTIKEENLDKSVKILNKSLTFDTLLRLLKSNLSQTTSEQ